MNVKPVGKFNAQNLTNHGHQLIRKYMSFTFIFESYQLSHPSIPITSRQILISLSFLMGLMALTYYLIKFWSIAAVTLSFQGQILSSLYLRTEWCKEMKNKHIDWMLSLKRGHQFWPWPWPWPWIFKVKFWNYCISGMAGPIDVKWKESNCLVAELAMWLWPLTTCVTLTLDI